MMRFVLCGFLCLQLAGPAGVAVRAATGVVYFNRIPTLNSAAVLHRANADGSAEEVVPLQLPEGFAPAVSRDGRRVLVTSGDPGRPFKISDNVYSVDLTTGAIGQVTAFEDVVTRGGIYYTNDLGQISATDSISSYTISFPNRKAFSPDGTAAVAVNMLMSGSVTGGSINVQLPSWAHSSTLETATMRAPFTDVFPVGAALPVGHGVFYGDQRTAYNQGGDGVDWHPQFSEIALCIHSDIPASGTSGLLISEGTLIAIFSTAGGNNAFIRKLTTPTAVWNSYVDLFNNFIQGYSQHDSAPAISPDGRRVAYVRHIQRTDTRVQLAPLPAICEIRSINYDGSDDRQVLLLAEGLWVTQLAWSPDNAEIAFDLAPQVVSGGIPAMLGDNTRSEIHAVRADGSNVRRIIAGPASFPAWATGQLGQPVRNLRAELLPNGDGSMRLRALVAPAPRSVQVETSADLINWAPAGILDAGMEWTITVTQKAKFFRFVAP